MIQTFGLAMPRYDACECADSRCGAASSLPSRNPSRIETGPNVPATFRRFRSWEKPSWDWGVGSQTRHGSVSLDLTETARPILPWAVSENERRPLGARPPMRRHAPTYLCMGVSE